MSPLLILLSLMILQTKAFKEYQRRGLEQHNKYRARHGVPDMILSEALNDMAERCAQWNIEHRTCGHSCPIRPNKTWEWTQEYKPGWIGENCFGGSGGFADPNNAAVGAADAFYAEIDAWNFYYPKDKYSHFSQLVWMGSTQLGIGVYNGKWGSCTVVKYFPGGNMQGMNKLMVFKPNMQESARRIYHQQYERSALVVKLGSKGTITIPKSPALLLSLAWLTMFCLKMGSKTLLLTLIPFIAFLINPSDAAVLEYQTVGQDAHNKFRSSHQVPPLTLKETLSEVAEKCAEYYANERKEIVLVTPHLSLQDG